MPHASLVVIAMPLDIRLGQHRAHGKEASGGRRPFSSLSFVRHRHIIQGRAGLVIEIQVLADDVGDVEPG